MKKNKLLIGLLSLCFSLCTVGVISGCEILLGGNDSDGSSSNSSSSSPSSEIPVEENVTVSGLSGTGYTVNGVNATVKKGTTIAFTVALDKAYSLSSPIVKINGEVVQAVNGGYSYTASDDVAISVENLVEYEKIAETPLLAEADSTNGNVAHAISSSTNVYEATYGVAALASTKLEAYQSLVFFMKSAGDDVWLVLQNAAGENVYVNAIPDPSGERLHIADDVWHKVGLKKETVNESTVYQLYVDDVKITEYNGNAVNAVASSRLSDFTLLMNDGTYEFSEVFAVADPDYVPVEVKYEIIASNPYATLEASEEITEGYPCEESEYVYGYEMAWKAGGDALTDLRLAPYTHVKFYIKSADGWIIPQAAKTGEALKQIEGGEVWHEFVVEKDGDKYVLIIDGEMTEFTFKKNLSELKFLHNDAIYYVSELFAMADPDYVAPTYSKVSEQPTAYEMTEVTDAEKTEHIQKVYSYTFTDFASVALNAFDLLPYEEAVLYVKSTTGAWVTADVGTTNVFAVNDTEWHKISFVKEDGYMKVVVDGGAKGQYVNDLAQIKMAFTGGDTVYISEVYGYADSEYEAAEVTVASGTGYEVRVDTLRLDENDKVVLGKGTEMKFTVRLLGNYNQSVITVKANESILDAVDGVYSLTVSEDTVITVEGVTENTGDKDLGDYTIVSESVFDAESTENTDVVEATMSSKSFVYQKDWSATPNVSFTSVTEAQYTNLKFFILGVNAGEWFQVRMDGGTSDLFCFEGDDITFHKIEFVKESGGTWSVYYDDVLKGNGIAKISEMDIYMFGTYYVSELFGIADPSYVPEVTYTVTVNADGMTVDGTLSASAGEDVTFTVTANDGYTLSADNAELVSSEGNVYTFKVSAISANVTVTITATEKSPTTEKSYTTVVACDSVESLFVNALATNGTSEIASSAGMYVAAESPSELVNAYKLYATSGWYQFKSVDLTKYTELKFWVNGDGTNWVQVLHGTGDFGQICLQPTAWVEVSFVKQGDDTWTMYQDGTEKATGITDFTNLSISFGGNHYITDLIGVTEEGYEPVEPSYTTVVESDSVESLFVNALATNGTSEIASGAGMYVAAESPSELVNAYKLYATSGWYQFKSVDLTKYTELKFWVNGDGSNWVQVLHGTGEFGQICLCPTAWVEVSFVKQSDATWTMYQDGAEKATGITDFTNLSISFGGYHYITDFIGIEGSVEVNS